jgi:oligosaccharide repeat unit polymerase
VKLAEGISTSRQGYYTAAFAFVLYAGFLLAKIVIYECGTPLSPGWKWLAILNVIEAIGWTWWIIERHGLRFGPVLLLLPLICCIYSTVPVSLLALGLNIFPYPDAAVRSGMYMQSLMATHLWLFCAVMFSSKQSRRLVERINGWFDALYITPTGIWLFILLGLAISLLFFIQFYTSGAASLLGKSSRMELNDTFDNGKTWLMNLCFAGWLISCAALCNSRRVRDMIEYRHSIVSTIAIILFMYVYIALGDRREIAFVIMFIGIMLCFRGKIWQIIFIIPLYVSAMIYFSLARSGDTQFIAYMNQVEYYRNLYGEFIFPHFPLIHHIALLQNYWLGSSYVTWLSEYVPTFGLWDKPLSIGTQFAKQMGGGMGYAYTPLGEGYANFGVISVLVVPLYLSLYMRVHCCPAIFQGSRITHCKAT